MVVSYWHSLFVAFRHNLDNMQGTPFTTQLKQKFLAKLLSSAGNVSKAAKAAGISRANAYIHRESDADFKQAWDDIIQQVADAMEEELYRRSVKGYQEPVFYRGKMVAKIRKFSDRLLEVGLKAKRPELYRERFDINQNVAGSLDVHLQHTIDSIYDNGPTDTTGSELDTRADTDG